MASPKSKAKGPIARPRNDFLCEVCCHRVIKVVVDGKERFLAPSVPVWFITPKFLDDVAVAVPGAGYVEHAKVCAGAVVAV